MTKCKSYKLTIKVEPEGAGFVRVDGGDPIRKEETLTFEQPETHEMRAVSGKGYRFIGWDNGWMLTDTRILITNNPDRVYVGDEARTITAYFESAVPAPQPEPSKCEEAFGHGTVQCNLPKGHEGQHQHLITW